MQPLYWAQSITKILHLCVEISLQKLTAHIDAWQMPVPDKSQAQRTEEGTDHWIEEWLLDQPGEQVTIMHWL